MTLYRTVPESNIDGRPHPDAFWSGKHGWLEEVKPCYHGRYDAHWGPHYIATPTGNEKQYREWCHGAGLDAS